jgi:hypothetical protein
MITTNRTRPAVHSWSITSAAGLVRGGRPGIFLEPGLDGLVRT